jgi:hypothetical protein
VYSTDFRLCPSQDALLLTALRADREDHIFTSIAHYAPDDLTYGSVFIVYPIPADQLKGIDEETIGSRQVALADLSRGQIYPAAGSGQLRPRGAPGAVIRHVSMTVPGKPKNNPTDHESGLD